MARWPRSPPLRARRYLPMHEHLVFTLAAAVASMGELAGHERRGSWSWPGRSSVLGLCAAALGIRRDGDFSALDGLGLAVAMFDTGEPLRDFHTAVSIPSSVAKRPQSRAEALRMDAGRSNSTITLRDYRVGVLYGVALWGEGLPAVAENLVGALRRPTFTLYLGRKSCPLAAPLAPRVLAAPNAATALAEGMTLPPWHAGARADQIATEEDLPAPRTETRHDRPTDRTAWHFAPRAVRLVPCDIAPRTAGQVAA